MNNIRTSI